HNVAGDVLEARAQGRSFAAILRLLNQPEAKLTLKRLEHLARPIHRCIVDNDELDSKRDRQDPTDDLIDRFPLVEDGHHHRHERVCNCPESRSLHGRSYPWGCVLCQSHAVRTIPSRSGNRGFQCSSATALWAAAYNTAGSPGRLGASVHGTWRPDTRWT